ncbi:MAG TPA: regulatory protein RecX [Salinivirgaceae bacterium]|mgnify:CR=1 FL=1|nr:regulatory protein RecX [Salinivirgaceae bacterium]
MLEKEYEIFLAKALRYCSTSEKCETDVRSKLIEWGIVDKNISQQIIDYLRQNNFINHERYVNAYVNDALRLKRYGKIKIRYQLINKQIDAALIEQNLSAIDHDFYLQMIRQEICKRIKNTRPNELEQQKIIRTMMGRGFEPELVRQILKEINSGFHD